MISRFLLLAILLCFVPELHAALYSTMADETLLYQSDMVVSGIVQDRHHPLTPERIETYYRIQVDVTYKGLHTDEITVAVPGGEGPQGIGLHLVGAPDFSIGEQVILFLSPREDGYYSVMHFFLGAFHIIETRGKALAVRDLSCATEVFSRKQAAQKRKEGTSYRDAVGFMQWLEEKSLNPSAKASYWTPKSDTGILVRTPKFALFGNRWQDFDQSRPVYWHANAQGQSGVAGGGFSEFREALSLWSDEGGSNVDYIYNGTNTADGGMTLPDYQNTILFDDPNDEIAGSFDCTEGGVLAVGGFFFYTHLHNYKGQSFNTIIEGDIVTQDGAGCFYGGNKGANATEVFAHELGHTLGLDHTGDPGALMYPEAHADGRGGFLGHDDQTGIRFLYESSTPAIPIVPAGLTASDGTFDDKVALEWGASDESDSYKLYRSSSYTSKGQAIYSGRDTSFDDFYSLPGVTYYYSLAACNDEGCSSLTLKEEGFRQGPTDPPGTPTELEASDGQYEDKVLISWKQPETTTSFRLHRSTVEGETGVPVYAGAVTEFEDYSAEPGVTYFYSIEACNSIGCSDPSTQESGFILKPVVPSTVNVFQLLLL